MKVLIYGQRAEKKDLPYIQELLEVLNDLQIAVGFYTDFHKKALDAGLDSDVDTTVDSHEELMDYQPDYLITMGGDGTILRAVTLVKDGNIPILGINLGRLGFLSSVEKKKIRAAITEISKGNFYLDERSLIGLECNHDIFGDTKFALNDFTITKRDNSSMIIIHTYIDGVFLNSYWADGIIVATPTGSTGYSLSCGGPIVFPDSNNFVITPIAPHNLNVRPVVISDDTTISFEIEGRVENFLSTLDSRYETITSHHKIKIKKCGFKIKLVQPLGTTFMSTINSKLMWGLDMRNY